MDIGQRCKMLGNHDATSQHGHLKDALDGRNIRQSLQSGNVPTTSPIRQSSDWRGVPTDRKEG